MQGGEVMFSRYCFRALGLMCLVLPIAGCTNTQVDSIAVAPTTQTLTVSQTVQFTATGTISHGNHPSSTEDVTDQVTWVSQTPSVATVTSTGLATAVGAGSATITATYPGLPPANATITVTGSGGTTTGGTVTSLTIIPSSQAVASPSQTTQFIAIGTTSTEATENLTSVAIWSSSNPQVATITSNGGLATAVGQGTTTITAIYPNGSTGTVATGTATFTVTSGSGQGLTALSITPGTQTVAAGGQTAQFIAIGTLGSTGLQEDVTDSTGLSWSTTIPSIATITTSGVVTGVSAGTTTVTALFQNPNNGGLVSATANVTVSTTAPPEPLLSLTIIPSSITVDNLQDTGNFLAVGTFSAAPYVRDLTNSVTWLSSEPTLFPVSTDDTTVNPGAPGGVVTAIGNGSATIIAEGSSGGTIQTATATFACPYLLPAPPQPGSCFVGSEAPYPLSTVTVYNEGLNTTDWQVTAPSATGTPDVIHCGPGWALNGGAGGSVCVASYPVGTPLVLTAPAGAGSFGGWSSNCTPTPNPSTAAGPNTCTITTTEYNVSVGAIFN
jgi:uncharacterized protein YjdB